MSYSEYVPMQKTSIERAIAALDKLKYGFVKQNDMLGVDEVSAIINQLAAMRETME